MDYSFRPIQKWPGEQHKVRKASRFQATYGQTLNLLEKELKHLGAFRVVFQVALTEDQIRHDGRPKSTARATHPGVIVSFESNRIGPHSFPCDTYKTWEDNLRAIALSLQALRTVDRYGVTKRGEQYTGWKALPESSNSSETAAKLLSHLSGISIEGILKDESLRDRAYKIAASKTHPDLHPDKQEVFIKVNEAVTLLRQN